MRPIPVEYGESAFAAEMLVRNGYSLIVEQLDQQINGTAECVRIKYLYIFYALFLQFMDEISDFRAVFMLIVCIYCRAEVYVVRIIRNFGVFYILGRTVQRIGDRVRD